ncbi:MAG TPA: hypothetical protein VFS21_22695 [Roseiflexaceae bacterium]|nr:hypothetical protein [Roseiflexaceae bacterium]
MPYTVNTSFQLFRSAFVDLDQPGIARAQAAQAALQALLKALPEDVGRLFEVGRPLLPSGPLVRGTAIRSLRMVALLWALDGTGATPQPLPGARWRIAAEAGTPLGACAGEDGLVEPGRIAERLVGALAGLPGCQRCEAMPDGAVRLELADQPWRIELRPALAAHGAAEQLVPDGRSAWKRADPLRQQRLLDEENRRHNGLLLPLIRLLSYWNSNYHSIPGVPADYLEALLLGGFQEQDPLDSLKGGVLAGFQQLAERLAGPCPDPYGLGPDLHTLIDQDTRDQMREKALVMAQFAQHGLYYERQGDQEEAIGWWRLLFFPDFPAYGS